MNKKNNSSVRNLRTVVAVLALAAFAQMVGLAQAPRIYNRVRASQSADLWPVVYPNHDGSEFERGADQHASQWQSPHQSCLHRVCKAWLPSAVYRWSVCQFPVART